MLSSLQQIVSLIFLPLPFHFLIVHRGQMNKAMNDQKFYTNDFRTFTVSHKGRHTRSLSIFAYTILHPPPLQLVFQHAVYSSDSFCRSTCVQYTHSRRCCYVPSFIFSKKWSTRFMKKKTKCLHTYEPSGNNSNANSKSIFWYNTSHIL